MDGMGEASGTIATQAADLSAILLADTPAVAAERAVARVLPDAAVNVQPQGRFQSAL